MIAEKLQEILSDVKEIKSEVDLQREALEILLNEEVSESEQFSENPIEGSDQQSETQNILDQLEEPANISTLSGIQKTRAVQQKIEIQNIKGQSLASIIPEANNRAVFRIAFQILFQAQRLKEQLVSFTGDKEVEMVLTDLNDALATGAESERLSVEQKITITQLQDEIQILRTEFKKPLMDQSIDKIKNFEKSLDENIAIVNQWVESFIPQSW